jgi:GDP-L-fucose synthase
MVIRSRWRVKANMSKVFVAGHKGMVGSAIVRQLAKQEGIELLLAGRDQLDLSDSVAVARWFAEHQPDQVYLAAAKVGGIHANNVYPADFISVNLLIQNNVINAACANGVHKLLFLGSSCIYPKLAGQPIKETSLLTGQLEPTNEPYAIAKIAGIKLCESLNRQYGLDYRSVMPTNLYGQNDNFHPQNSHVIPAMMQRFHQAKELGADGVSIWGTGNPMREFLHVDDMAAACVYVMNLPRATFIQTVPDAMCSHVNVGTGVDCTIRELAKTMAIVVGFEGKLQFDTSRPDGTPRKLLCVRRLHDLGWAHSVELEKGLAATYEWFLSHLNELRN